MPVQPGTPAWIFNLATRPDEVWAEVGRRKFKVRPTDLKAARRADRGQTALVLASESPHAPPIVGSGGGGVAVEFINTDGMAFIGPGSEWLWTAVSGIVLAVTFLAIYRQLRLARSASAREQLAAMDRDWMSERMTRYQLAIVTALCDGADRAQLPDGPASGLANWWERIGQLARSGDIDRKTLYPGYGVHAQAWWAILAPYVRQKRAEQGNPRNFEDNEWLAGTMAEIDRRTGKPPVDEAMLGPFEVLIVRLQDRLRVEEALRTIIVASPDALSSGQAAPAATSAPAPI